MALWFRSWHGAPTDNKWLVIAHRANVAPGIVSAVVWALFDHASQNEERGSVKGFDAETYAAFSGFSETNILAVISALQEKGVIQSDGMLTNWQKRQPKREDDSSERVRNWRNKNVTQCNAEKRSVTHGNNTDTEVDTEVDTETDAETETEKQLQLSPAWEAFIKARGVNVNPNDPQYIGELEALYGSDAVAQAIYYCDTHKKNNYLAVSYISKMLSVWQGEGSLGLHPPGTNGNGNGKAETPKKRTQRVYDAEGNLVEVEVDA